MKITNMITDVNTKYQLSNTPRTSRRNIEKLRKPKNASGRLRQTQKQTETQAGRQAGRQTDNTDKQSRYTNTQRHGHIGRQTDRQTDTVRRDIHTNRADIQTHRDTDT